VWSRSRALSELSKTIATSAIPTGFRFPPPAKMTSIISFARRELGRCSPSTHFIASMTFDFPQPLGPTIAVMPGSRRISVFRANDLKPSSWILLILIERCPRRHP